MTTNNPLLVVWISDRYEPRLLYFPVLSKEEFDVLIKANVQLINGTDEDYAAVILSFLLRETASSTKEELMEYQLLSEEHANLALSLVGRFEELGFGTKINFPTTIIISGCDF